MSETLEEIGRTVKGLAVITDWLGYGGKVVDKEVAERRSMTCLQGDGGSMCRFNKASSWWDTAKGSIAQAIRDILEVKNKVKLSVPNEDLLAMCQKCGCCQRVKVWVPTEHVRRHTSKELEKDLPEWCWMRKELSSGDPL